MPSNWFRDLFGFTGGYLNCLVAVSIFSFYKLDKPYVINLEISKEESIKRLIARGRFDDNKRDIEERLSWFETEVEKSLEFYRNNPNCHFLKIKADRSIEEIHKDIVSLI